MEKDAGGLSPPRFALLFTVTLVTAIGNLGLVSVMPAIGRALAIPDTLVAGIFSLSALAWAVTSPYWARLSDRMGRRPMLVVGLGGFSFSMLGCALVVVAGLQAVAAPLAIFVTFTVVRASYGLFGSAAPTAAQALIADRTEGQGRVQALTGIAGALSIGTILGPAVAPFLLFGRHPLAGPPLAFAAAGIVLIAAVMLIIPKDKPRHFEGERTDTPSLWRDSGARPLLIMGLVVSSAQAINIYTLGFSIIDSSGSPELAQWWIGAAMSLGAVASLLAQMGFVRLLKPDPHWMLGGGAALALAGNLCVLSGGLAALISGFVLAAFGYGLARPGFSAAASIAVGPERQGAVAGAVSSIAGASIAVPPVLAIACYQYWPGAPAAMAALGSMWVAAAARRHMRMFPTGD